MPNLNLIVSVYIYCKNKDNMSIEDDAKKIVEAKEKKTIGRVDVSRKIEEPAKQLGYKAVDINVLPSRGWFYPNETKIAIAPAKIAEIRHWSTIEESDPISVDASLNFIMERCVKINMPGSISTFKDLKEIDRLYLLFAVRELTFQNGQNALTAEYYDNDKLEKVELTKEMISYFDMPADFEEYYNNERKCFVFVNPDDAGETLDIYFPSIGISEEVEKWKNNRLRKRRTVEKDFLSSIQFLTKTWRDVTDKNLDDLAMKSNNWSLWKISMLSYITSLLIDIIDPTMTIKKSNGEEDVMPLNFQGGLKAVFIIPNPLGRPRRD